MTAIEPIPSAKQIDPFLKAFERFEQAGSSRQPSWLFPLRKAGLARFAEMGFPTLKHEDWRFTNIAAIARLPFKPVFEPATNGLTRDSLNQFPFAQLPGTRLVFLNGIYSAELSTTPDHIDGIKVSNLSAALANDPALIEKHLGRYALVQDNAFIALNNAFFQDGGFVYVPAAKFIKEPVQFLFLSTSKDTGTTSHPRNLIIAERGSKATIIESYISLANGATVTNSVTEFALADNSAVEHCKLQDESRDAFHIAALHSHLGRAVNFSAHSISLGAKLSRNNIRTTLDGEGIECILNGVYLTGDEQLADHHMIVDHAKAHCASHEYFNGILAGKSRGVFHGRILVRPGAQKTDAKQTNKNLLLSDEATADAKPQLEIYADDVKCTHGATIGQLNDESIYYLRSRGIGLDTARRMLIHAFAGEIVDRVKHDALREELDALVWDRLEQQESIVVGKPATAK
jgi:Fe-S cluster assembly protein SufD